jgi:hypothetical protein
MIHRIPDFSLQLFCTLGQQAKEEWKKDLTTKRRCLSWECQADGR